MDLMKAHSGYSNGAVLDQEQTLRPKRKSPVSMYRASNRVAFFQSQSRGERGRLFNTIGPLRNEAEARQLPAAQRHLAGLMPQADASRMISLHRHRAVWLEKLREAGRAPPG
jgi:hypothetical protein